jgi:hypothetical protein
MGRARQRGHLNPRPTRKTSKPHDPSNNPSQLAAAGEKPCPNDWPCRTTTEVNPPQRSTKQREKSGLVPAISSSHRTLVLPRISNIDRPKSMHVVDIAVMTLDGAIASTDIRLRLMPSGN